MIFNKVIPKMIHLSVKQRISIFKNKQIFDDIINQIFVELLRLQNKAKSRILLIDHKYSPPYFRFCFYGYFRLG